LLFGVENDKDARAARIVRDIYRHSMRIIAGTEAVGGYDGSRFCSEQMRAARDVWQDRRRTDHAAVSKPNDFLAREVKPDDLGPIGSIEMALDRIAHILLERREIVCFREDRLAESVRGVPALGRLFDKGNDLIHRLHLSRSLRKS
jgi:hypothetical protein